MNHVEKTEVYAGFQGSVQGLISAQDLGESCSCKDMNLFGKISKMSGLLPANLRLKSLYSVEDDYANSLFCPSPRFNCL